MRAPTFKGNALIQGVDPLLIGDSLGGILQ